MAKAPKPLLTIGDNPLDAIIPGAATLAAIRGYRPAPRPAAERAPTTSLTINLPPELIARLQHTIGATAGTTIDAFAREAFTRALAPPPEKSVKKPSAAKPSAKPSAKRPAAKAKRKSR